jgi:hypothetical protein
VTGLSAFSVFISHDNTTTTSTGTVDADSRKQDEQVAEEQVGYE